MSDYIKRQDVLDIVHKEIESTTTYNEHHTQINIKFAVEELPTLDEKEIIRKTVERIISRYTELMPIQFNGFGKTLITLEDAINVVKEEGGIE